MIKWKSVKPEQVSMNWLNLVYITELYLVISNITYVVSSGPCVFVLVKILFDTYPSARIRIQILSFDLLFQPFLKINFQRLATPLNHSSSHHLHSSCH